MTYLLAAMEHLPGDGIIGTRAVVKFMRRRSWLVPKVTDPIL